MPLPVLPPPEPAPPLMLATVPLRSMLSMSSAAVASWSRSRRSSGPSAGLVSADPEPKAAGDAAALLLQQLYCRRWSAAAPAAVAETDEYESCRCAVSRAGSAGKLGGWCGWWLSYMAVDDRAVRAAGEGGAASEPVISTSGEVCSSSGYARLYCRSVS